MGAPGRGAPPGARSDLPSWHRVLFTGLALWVASVVVTRITGNVNTIPTVVLLGSFLVPVTAVTWYLDHYHNPVVTLRLVFYTFIVGGVLGTLSASVLESWLLSDGVFVYVGVGLIEEAVKLVALAWIARGLPRYTLREGIVLGAAIGFGFGALESSGYALAALVVLHGRDLALSLSNLVLTELLRGLLAPVEHGLWTAILGGVLFRESRAGRLHLTGKVLGAYLFVVLLHALWDAMRGIATVLTATWTATPAQRIALAAGVLLPPAPGQLAVFLEIEIGGLVLIALAGLLVLWRLWHAGARQDAAA